MEERTVYMNGEFIPESEAKTSIFDRSFYMGDAVFDTSRSLRHKPYKFQEHIDRLYNSLKYMRIDPGLSMQEMLEISEEVLRRNVPLLDKEDDYWLSQNISRGVITPLYGHMDFLAAGKPTVVVFCEPIPFAAFAPFMKNGIDLATPSIRRTPPQCLDSKIKARNYINHILAEIEAQQISPECHALMLDLNGYITENTGANFFTVSKGRLLTPGRHNILCGISRQTVIELANELGIPVIEDDRITVYDVYNSEEAFITSTSCCMAPVRGLNGVKIGDRIPGPITELLQNTWSEKVGIDIVYQFLRHLKD